MSSLGSQNDNQPQCARQLEAEADISRLASLSQLLYFFKACFYLEDQDKKVFFFLKESTFLYYFDVTKQTDYPLQQLKESNNIHN